jgi:TrwC relaxase
MTRSGYHGARIGGREPGRFEPAGLIVTSWLQGTSRDGDPQDHVHNQIARITRTLTDGKWRALDTMTVRVVLGALQAIAATAVECELTAELGVAWVPRADGRGNEIAGVTQAQMDAYSTRTVQVHEKERELARVWSASMVARRIRASCCTSRMTPRCGRARARTQVRSTGMRSPRGGTPRSEGNWPISRRPCRPRAAQAHRRRASIPGAARRPGRPRGPRRGRWPRPWFWSRPSTRPGPGTTCSSSSPWSCRPRPGR